MADSIHAAMAAAFSKMPTVELDGANPHFRSKYTTLGEIIRKVRPVLAANGLYFIQTPVFEEGRVGVRTTIHHASGESVDCGVVSFPVAQADAQKIGSAITYAKRYGLAAALAIADQDDDDGNAAAAGGPAAAPAKASKPKPKPEPATKAAFCVAVEKVSGIKVRDDAMALAKKIATKLGVNGDAGPDEWKRAIEDVEAHAHDLIEWAQS